MTRADGVLVTVLSAVLLGALVPARPASADVVLLDEYWTPEILVNDVVVTEIDTLETEDPTQAKSGEFSALLENFSGWPNVRFRGSSRIVADQLPPGYTEAGLWYRTDAWEGPERTYCAGWSISGLNDRDLGRIAWQI